MLVFLLVVLVLWLQSCIGFEYGSTPLFPINSVIFKFIILQDMCFSGVHTFHFGRNA